MTVTALIPETKGRYRVCLQGEADLVLYGKELKQFGIAEGTDLSPEQYRRILEEVLIPRARKRAMHILERIDQTTAQLREKLQRSQYPEPVVEDAIAYVASFHYIDDERFARNFIRAYQQSRSRLRISRDLQGKGINRDLIDRCLAEEYEVSETDQIRELLRRKGYDRGARDRKQQDKMYRFLMQRGYRSEDIRRALWREDF